MTERVRTAMATMFPFAQDEDAHAAIDWLCHAFGSREGNVWSFGTYRPSI